MAVGVARDLYDIPRAVRVLGEDLVLFRDEFGKLGLLGLHCPHRGTSLEYGDIENGGLRCPYHGWLFDVTGQCLEMPAEPKDSKFPQKVKHLSYPVQELGGFIFAYMGPDKLNPPPLPKYAPLLERGGQRQIEPVRYADYNWFNFFENSADPAHVCILHRHAGYGQQSWGNQFFSYTDMPHFEFVEMAYGMKVVMTKPGPKPDTEFVDEMSLALPSIVQVGDTEFVHAKMDAAALMSEGSRCEHWMFVTPNDDEHFMEFCCRPHSTRLAAKPLSMQQTRKNFIDQPDHKQNAQLKFIGSPTPRLEGPEKVSGKAIYAGDVSLPGMLWCKVLRSPIAYGRIKQIDVSHALSLPGVAAIIGGKDVSGLLIGRKIYDMPILADGVVRFIGEKVVAVAAETEEIADEAVRLIEVDYEELPPIFDPREALEPSAPLLHPNVQRYRGLLHPIEQPTNVFIDMKWTKGDIEAGFSHADIIVENTFTTRPVHQAYIEPHACVVKSRADGGADVWGCSKVPFALREQVATAFGQSVEKFIVHPCYIGGCFGGKGDFMDVPVCYALSLKRGRAVKMVMDYGEEFVAGNPRHATETYGSVDEHSLADQVRFPE